MSCLTVGYMHVQQFFDKIRGERGVGQGSVYECSKLNMYIQQVDSKNARNVSTDPHQHHHCCLVHFDIYGFTTQKKIEKEQLGTMQTGYAGMQ